MFRLKSLAGWVNLSPGSQSKHGTMFQTQKPVCMHARLAQIPRNLISMPRLNSHFLGFVLDLSTACTNLALWYNLLNV